MRDRQRFSAATLVAGLLFQACANAPGEFRARPADPELLHTAVHDLTGVIIHDILSPPQASRVYAYASIAAYEALRPGSPAYRTLAGQLNGLAPVPAPEPDLEYSLPLASLHAFLTVGQALTFSRERMDSVRSDLQQRIRSTGVPAATFERSIAFGDRVAEHILAWAAQDRFLQTRGYPKYTVTSAPGRWVPTPPAYMDGLEPHWGKLRPFALDSAGQVPPDPPLPYDMTAGSPFYREAREVYELGKQLTEEQKRLVAHWDDNPFVMHVQGHTMYATKKMTPGGHWMAITTMAARKAGADLMGSAEAYARTAIALADGFISCWEEKFRSALVRPETVINAHFDAAWEPLLQTPPFPEYTSGHSVISTAAATVLTDQFGAGFAFIDSTEAEFGLPVRSYTSFEDAAAEAAISRLYGGIHYRRAVEQGIAQGRKVGELVVRQVRTRAEPAVTQGSSTGAPEPSSGDRPRH